MRWLVFVLVAACSHPGSPAIATPPTGGPVSVDACTADAVDETDPELY